MIILASEVDTKLGTPYKLKNSPMSPSVGMTRLSSPRAAAAAAQPQPVEAARN